MADISVIVPTRNRAAILAKTLESVGSAVQPNTPVEIIVVDNGSTDKTTDAFNEISAKFSDREWRYFYEPMPGLLSGRHKGASESKGEILSFLDDDVLLAPNWLDALQEAFADPDVALVGGPSQPRYEVTLPNWLDVLWSESDEGRSCGALSLIDFGRTVRAISPEFVWGLNFSIRKAAFQRCGGFHPDCIPKPLQRYQGDGETGLSRKIEQKGLRALYHPGACVTHLIPASRLELAAVQQRAFYQGVCDSYSQIRQERGVPAPECHGRNLLRPAKRLIKKMLFHNAPLNEVRELLLRAYSQGVDFHRSQVYQDPELLAWVLKESYFDYELPDGWQRYMS